MAPNRAALNSDAPSRATSAGVSLDTCRHERRHSSPTCVRSPMRGERSTLFFFVPSSACDDDEALSPSAPRVERSAIDFLGGDNARGGCCCGEEAATAAARGGLPGDADGGSAVGGPSPDAAAARRSMRLREAAAASGEDASTLARSSMNSGGFAPDGHLKPAASKWASAELVGLFEERKKN